LAAEEGGEVVLDADLIDAQGVGILGGGREIEAIEVYSRQGESLYGPEFEGTVEDGDNLGFDEARKLRSQPGGGNAIADGSQDDNDSSPNEKSF
jgi:hypothetical protein